LEEYRVPLYFPNAITKAIECSYFEDSEASDKLLAREIFERLHAHCKYDGHTVSVWKNDLISIAKEYGVDLTVYEDSEAEAFSIGDLVASDRLPNLMGRITKLPRTSGRSKGLAVVTVTDWTGKDTTLLVSLDKWHKIKEG
jgi:hypothetical protein